MQGNYFWLKICVVYMIAYSRQAERMYVLFVVALLLVFYLHWQGPRFDLLHHLGAQLAQADPDARHFCLLLREHMAWCVQYAKWHNSCEM